MQSASTDRELLEKFDGEVWAKVPHFEGGAAVNSTPLVEVTDVLIECARTEYGLKLNADGLRVFAKFDSKIHGGSVKVRPAASIIRDAISSGSLVNGQTIFEATSGNFGIALNLVGKLGLNVVALVSRRLQDGVTGQLRSDGVKLINLDIDICPAPGFQGSADVLIAKGVATNVRQQLSDLDFDPKAFDKVRGEAEELLGRQDVIGLAKLLARAYHGFCPQQYDNDLNVDVHKSVTGPELDGQLFEKGTSMGEADFVCTFGTGGTATGISRYLDSKYGKKGVRVVFPQAGQDVAGIRTREKATGLRFYEPEAYLGEHEVDFEETSRLFQFFNKKGFDTGESGALALYACMQLVNYGAGKKFVVMVADGASKYMAEVKAVARRGKRDQVRLDEAASAIEGYSGVVWAHNMFVPREEGMKVIASALGVDQSKVKVADVMDVQAVLNGGEPSAEFVKLLPTDDKPILVVCMAGNTSLMLAKVLERSGVAAESLVGGITGLPASRGKPPFELVKIARS
jgi:cysteine synthase/rhodanese-related sulfurtransferase